MIPLHLSGLALAGIFATLALCVVVITWCVLLIAQEWREVGFSDDAESDK